MMINGAWQVFKIAYNVFGLREGKICILITVKNEKNGKIQNYN